jgi:DNA-binding transcriptional MerR regulator
MIPAWIGIRGPRRSRRHRDTVEGEQVSGPNNENKTRNPGTEMEKDMNTATPADLASSEETFRIGELSNEFDVTLRTLRFYEDKGLLSPRRIGNTRLYSRADRARLKLILLGKRVGLSLLDVKEILDLYDPSGNNQRQLAVAIEKGAEQMDVLRKQREEIDGAIEELDKTLVSLRSHLTNSEK